MKNMLAIVVAAGLGLAAVFLVQDWLEKQRRDLLGAVVEVVIAREDLPAGTELALEHVQRAERMKRYIDDDAVTAGEVETALGQRLAVAKSKGAPLRWSDFKGRHGTGSLAEQVPPGKRAVTLAVDGLSGFAGMLLPNDRVDILFQYTPQADLTAAGAPKSVIRYFMSNVQVLALDRTTGRETRGAALVGTGSSKEGKYGTVTFAVNPMEAEMLVFAETQGTMRFLLRNSKDDAAPQGAAPIDSENFHELFEGVAGS